MKRHRGSRESLPLFSSASILPAQFFSQGGVAASGEKKLLLAVLERAISDLCSPCSSQSSLRDREEARRWFESRDDSSAYSFVRICETLGLDPDALRKGILALEKEEWWTWEMGKARATRWRQRSANKRENEGGK